MFLPDENRDAMLPNAVEQLGDGLVVQVRQISPIESGIGGQILRQIKAERYLPLKPRLHRVPVGRNHLRRQVPSEHGEVLIEYFSNQRSTLSGSNLHFARVELRKRHA